MLRSLALAAAFVAPLGCAEGDLPAIPYVPPPARPAQGIPANTTPCTVERVADGDTLTCTNGERIRLLNIDTPEMSQAPFGDQARTVLLRLAPVGSQLQMEFDVQLRDSYGRILAYLYDKDGRLLNEEMLRLGMATMLVIPPNVKHVDRLRAVLQDAQARKVGLWATNGFDCEPRDHRAGRC